jgi:type IV pilus assembly protein PilB
MPVNLMINNAFVPIKREADSLVIAISDPTNLDLIDELSSKLKTKIRTAVATRAAIEHTLKEKTLLNEFYKMLPNL